MEKLSELSFWCKWRRPVSVPYPNTWHRFTAKTKDGKDCKIKIVDLTPDRFEESIEFTKKYFYLQEPLTVSSKLLDDEISFHNYLCENKAILQQQISIIAVLDEDVPKPEIVGTMKLLVASKEDNPMPHIPGDKLQERHLLIGNLMKNHNPLEIFNLDKVIRGKELCVKTEYAGMNIGYNILLTIEKLAKAFHIKASMIICSNIRSQVLAEKAGYKMLNEIVYDDFKDDQGRILFPIEGTKSIKLMATEFTQIDSK